MKIFLESLPSAPARVEASIDDCTVTVVVYASKPGRNKATKVVFTHPAKWVNVNGLLFPRHPFFDISRTPLVDLVDQINGQTDTPTDRFRAIQNVSTLKTIVDAIWAKGVGFLSEIGALRGYAQFLALPSVTHNSDLRFFPEDVLENRAFPSDKIRQIVGELKRAIDENEGLSEMAIRWAMWKEMSK